MFDLGSLVRAPRGGLADAQREHLGRALDEADAVVVGAGAGLSTAAGLAYTGPRFEAIFGDFIEKYHFTDMYSGGFYSFDSLEEHWAYWSRYIWCNRYVRAPGTAYDDLLTLVRGKDHFVLTTNVDHQFQLAGTPRTHGFTRCNHRPPKIDPAPTCLGSRSDAGPHRARRRRRSRG